MSGERLTRRSFGNGEIVLCIGDITEERADAIVNAANTRMMGGGGVDGAIHRAAGSSLLASCRAMPSPDGVRCPTGETRVTHAGNLYARIVIHAVGPVYNDNCPRDADALLAKVHDSAFADADRYECRTIAFPAISTGVYGFPVDRAADIAIARSVVALKANASLCEVRFVLFDDRTAGAFRAALEAAKE